MKRLSSPASLRIGIGTFLHLLGGTLVILGVFFFPMILQGYSDSPIGGPPYIVYIAYSEWFVVHNRLNEPLLSLLLDAVFVALPLLSMFFVLGISTARLLREVSSRIVMWRRRAARIAAIVGFIMHFLLGALAVTFGSLNARIELGVGFGLVLLGFSVMIVSTFLD
jgi:hypothetical protein